MQPEPGPVTQFLEAIGTGDAPAAEQLLPWVYEELRRLAAARMAEEPPGQTLQATSIAVLASSCWPSSGMSSDDQQGIICEMGSMNFVRSRATSDIGSFTSSMGSRLPFWRTG